MGSHSIGGILVGLVAAAAGGLAIWTAVSTRRNRAQTAATYRSMGGPFFTAVQYGCGGVLVLAGLVVIGFALLGERGPMITRERPAVESKEKAVTEPPQAGGGGSEPPPPPVRGEGWWRSWPTPPNRPRPINRSSLVRGGLVVSVALLAVDGALGVMAWQASGRWLLGLAVGTVLFAFTALEFGVVAWAAKRRQDQEIRNSR